MEINYIERIKALKSQKKITNSKLSELTGIPLGTLAKMLAGISDSPKLSNIVEICKALDVSLDYVVTGVPDNVNNCLLDDEEIKLIESYRKLDIYGKGMIKAVADKESERVADMNGGVLPDIKHPDATPGQLYLGRKPMRGGFRSSANAITKRRINLYDMPVSAGIGEYLGEGTSTVITIPHDKKTRDADFALRINGDSMEPKYRNGDIILVQDCDTIEVGELGVFILDGQGYFKKYDGDRLISLNPEYPPILLKNFHDVQCSGRVLTKLKKK